MQISQRQPGQFELKVRDTAVSIGPLLAIGDYVLSGPGEYEVAGVMAEVTTHAARLVVDDFQIGYLRLVTKKLPDQELEQLGTVDVLFAPISSEASEGLTPKEAITFGGQVEARLIVPMLTEPTSHEAFQAAVPQAETITSPLKITRSQLPEEGSRILLFD